MPTESNSVLDFLNDITEPTEIFSEKPVIESTEIQEGTKDDKPVPFHKDPKVQRYVEKEIEKALGNKTQTVEKNQEVVPSDVKDVIEAFTAIIGNDTPEKVRALEKLEKTLQGSDERASTKAIERFQQQVKEQEQQQTQAEKAAQDELDTYFDEIEETYNVDLSSNSASAKQMRSQFIDYVRKIAPKDEKGEVKAFPDMMASFEDFQERQKRTIQPTRAKELASRGLTRSSDTTSAVPQGRSWKDVDRYFDKLKATN